MRENKQDVAKLSPLKKSEKKLPSLASSLNFVISRLKVKLVPTFKLFKIYVL